MSKDALRVEIAYRTLVARSALITLQVYTKEDGVRTGGWMFPGGWVSAVLQLGGQQLVGDTRGRVWVYAGGRGTLVSTHQVFTSAPVASIQVRPP